MKLSSEARDLLASEYVLGTQSGRVRRRLQHLLDEDEQFAARVQWWEQQLNQLSGALEPVPVPPRVWEAIKRQLQAANDEVAIVPVPGTLGKVGPWRWSAGLAAAAALLMALYLLIQQPPEPIEIPVEVVREVPVEVIREVEVPVEVIREVEVPVEVVREVEVPVERIVEVPVEVPIEVTVEVPVPAEGGLVLVLTDAESKTAWLVSRKSSDSPLVADPIQLPVLSVQQAYQLWLLAPDENPIPMGLLSDQQATELRLPEELDALLQPGFNMAVSIEPPGGSPTGAPTGPVVFTGAIKEL